MRNSRDDSLHPRTYVARFEDRWGEGAASDGLRYICIQAYDKQDARKYLRGYKRLELARVKIDEDFRLFIEGCGQEVRKLIYEGAASFGDLDDLAPGWRTREADDRMIM